MTIKEITEKYKDIFHKEASEYLETMSKSLLKLEKNPSHTGLIKNILRAAHTLKSTSALMDYRKMSVLCHVMEDLLRAVENKKIRLESCVDTLFECFDILRLNLQEVAEDKEEVDMDGLVQRLKNLLTRKEMAGSTDRLAENAEQSVLSTIAKVPSIEVKVEKLDLLMNLAEELLIIKMRFDTIKEDPQKSELSAAIDALERVVTNMQYNVMQVRMVPIEFIFHRFPRMVRDLAKQEKKEVNLEIEESNIELDRTIVEEIGEPLIHLLRNAVDHGIESPEERTKLGKPIQGTIKLTASRSKGFVVIEVEDDGAGIDWQEIKDKVSKQGILTQNISKQEISDLLFSGLSTSKKVTQISGRGLGLNIVKKKIDSMGGSIRVKSELTKGTKFVIKIPLTLAIVKALLVDIGGQIYTIPLVNVDRLITVNSKDIKGMMNYEAIVLDEEDIPITRLFNPVGSMLSEAITPDKHKGISNEVKRQASRGKTQPIVILKGEEDKVGLAVDAFLGTQEIIIKPIHKLVKENKNFAGCSIIGSGKVVLVLDVSSLILSKKQYGE